MPRPPGILFCPAICVNESKGSDVLICNEEERGKAHGSEKGGKICLADQGRSGKNADSPAGKPRAVQPRTGFGLDEAGDPGDSRGT